MISYRKNVKSLPKEKETKNTQATNDIKDIKSKKKDKKKKKSKKGLFNKGLFKLSAATIILGCAVILITTENDCSDKENELAAVQARIDAYNIENEELRRTLESDDLSAYMERIALEERGYAYPDERRFYDTSRD